MKQQLSILAGAFAAFCLPLQAWGQETAAPIAVEAVFGPDIEYDDVTDVQITNLQGEPLGRIGDLTLDLSNGRVEEVLVVSGQTLGFDGKTVAVPPRALIPDAHNKVYEINMSAEVFAAAPTFDLAKWAEFTQADKVAAAYRYFGQVTNFLTTNEAAGRTSPTGRLLEGLGTVERMTKLIGMPVVNLKGTRIGRLQSLVLDVPNGRILNAYIEPTTSNNADAFHVSSTVVPAMLLSFTAARDGLVLDVSKVKYNTEPHVIFQVGAEGQPVSTNEQAATGPHTNTALVQGTSHRDINITFNVYNSIQTANLDPQGKVEVGTKEGRVTLRGSVNSKATKDSIGAIASALVRLDNVDNQIVVAPSP